MRTAMAKADSMTASMEKKTGYDTAWYQGIS